MAPLHQGQGVGRAIIAAMLRDVNVQRPQWRVFTLTGQPEFFTKVGFRTVRREMFPEKIWSDCRNCPKNTCCDEVAMLHTDEDRRG